MLKQQLQQKLQQKLSPQQIQIIRLLELTELELEERVKQELVENPGIGRRRRILISGKRITRRRASGECRRIISCRLPQ